LLYIPSGVSLCLCPFPDFDIHILYQIMNAMSSII
jgi:hypothetical protein